ncbi:hypothetical protein Q31b_49760 [Novipirellula aureliae]|uniref:Uncharacterized protein n=1 Tax=Novipirellula aureliae TaxID=2527966 RepID=A0A5C6DKS3_9BACT|nr:hypothetical protein [Novipirellula aureliae]TWU36694.1 hypothetical protein Q31b_49760 [Novipirellula aureliae]
MKCKVGDKKIHHSTSGMSRDPSSSSVVFENRIDTLVLVSELSGASPDESSELAGESNRPKDCRNDAYASQDKLRELDVTHGVVGHMGWEGVSEQGHTVFFTTFLYDRGCILEGSGGG